MRYPADHKPHVRERIVRAASHRFRDRGGDVAIAKLMRDLRLTHGGFYRHFDSKEQLFAEAIGDGFDEVATGLSRAAHEAPAGGELKAIIETYLSLEHCENRAEGCPLAALAPEVGRRPRSGRLAFEGALRPYVRRMALFLPGASDAERELNFALLFSGMAGTLNLARAIADTETRRAILDAAKRFYVKAFAS
jgi:TetR/AcrR family transcriptional regulator, transcriptional repressor for nem operon